jgi:predicted alpha/beta-hydrolase family hydrolase
VTGVDIATSQGPARADLAAPGGDGPLSFLLVLTHGAGGSVDAPDLLAVRDAALQQGGATALVTQPYRVRGARAPGSAARQDEAWQEIIAFLRAGSWFSPGAESSLGERSSAGKASSAGETRLSAGEAPLSGSAGKAPLSRSAGEAPLSGEAPPGPRLPLIVGGRSNGARVACRTAVAVGASGVIALAFPLRPPARRAAAGSAATSGRPTRDAELRAAAEGGARVLVVNGDSDPFGIPDPGPAIRVVVLEGESHSLSRRPGAVAGAVTRWLSRAVPLAH